MLERFYEQNREEVAILVKDFLTTDTYPRIPGLQDVATVIATGSVGSGNYDSYSDIDLKVIFPTAEALDEHRFVLKEYKEHIRESGEPIQLHTSAVIEDIKKSLSTWQDDDLSREMAQALVIVDPNGQFQKLMDDFRYYPETVHREKIRWLFAELILQIQERFEVAQARGDAYFCGVVRMNIIRIAFNTLLLLDMRWPSFDKHLYRDVQSLKAQQPDIFVSADALITENDLTRAATLIGEIRNHIEGRLIRDGFITKESDQYWIDLRPEFQVKLG